MPRKDGTGPQGRGPETGRGMGGCAPEKKVVQDTQQLPRDGRGAARNRRGGVQVQRSKP